MIIHMIRKTSWESAKALGYLTDTSLEIEGFIHCSLTHQVVKVADKHYPFVQNMLLLCIDEDRLKSKLVYEDLPGLGEDYPHVYGVINLDAVTKVIEFPCHEKGSFELPTDLC